VYTALCGSVKCSLLHLNLHRIMLTVSSLNIGAVKAYTRAGFQQEGVLRQASYRDGAYHDKIIMAILRPEWEASLSAKRED
jgi:RimJ/RimL family protein N-acetyltransferase